MTNNSKRSLPAKLEGYSLDDLELFCTCTHHVNEHDGGLGGGDSICEVENCGCVSCEFDYEFTVMMHYFQGNYDNWLITKMTTDAKKFWTATMGGLPALKEPCELVVKIQKGESVS